MDKDCDGLINSNDLFEFTKNNLEMNEIEKAKQSVTTVIVENNEEELPF